MSRRELDAAGITAPTLRTAYEQCRRLNATHGRSYYLATLLLPRAKRPYVHALYGFARYADELVDGPRPAPPATVRAWVRDFLDDLRAGRLRPGDSVGDLVSRAAVHTALTWSLPPEHFDAFLESMQSDLDVSEYPTYADLQQYMYGSAAVVGLLMLPILEPLDPAASGPARALGEAFQLTNFIRDVGEDLRRGRVYLPLEDLDRFGVTRADLGARAPSRAVTALLAFEVERARELYRRAEPGAALLHPSSRDCVRTATALYGGILDAVERSGYDVLSNRVSVSLPARLRLAAPAMVRARRAHRTSPPAVPRPAG